ncbi:carboxypeptidase Taq [Lachnospiraceae bacterium YSD2013]|nr:carboxypeptidase Taq [Lachnospiraceae bacterium YSD2013]
MSELLDKFKAYLAETTNLGHASTLLYWDLETSMPKEGFKGHSDALAYLSTESFKRSTSTEMGEFLDKLSAPAEFDALDSDWKYIVKQMKKNYDENKRVPADFYHDFIVAQNEAGVAWQDAKAKKDFSIFAPHLEKMIDFTKKMMGYMRPHMEVYDALLDSYEEGMDSATYDRVFNELKEGLLPLLNKILAAKPYDESKFKKEYDIPAQKAVEKFLLEYIGFSFDKGCTGETEHPFTLNFNSKDVRVSNHFRTDNAVDPMFSAIHEGGHAIFEQNVAERLDDTVAGSCNYLGLHESQSRFYENVLGRNINFWKPIYAKLQEIDPDFKDITIDEFYRYINSVKNSLIRTQADEVTYCLHVIVRYEIEQEIFRNNVPVSELPALWNKKMEEYLHITPPTDAEGILQDMHWSDGSFGYFPTYLLGTIYDGMFLEAVEKDLGSIDTVLAEGRIKDITKWLNEHIHQYGSSRKPKEVIQAVCGREVSAQPILKYFTEKYTKIYNL